VLAPAQELRATVEELQAQVSKLPPEVLPLPAPNTSEQPRRRAVGTVGIMFAPENGNFVVTDIKPQSSAATSGLQVRPQQESAPHSSMRCCALIALSRRLMLAPVSHPHAQPDDVILEVNNKPVHGQAAASVSAALAGPLGSRVTLLCVRGKDGDADTLAVVLTRDLELLEQDLPVDASAQLQFQGDGDAGPDKGRSTLEVVHEQGMGTIGILIWPLDKEVAISDTKEKSSAALADLRVGDIIREIDGLRVDASMLHDAVERMKGPLGSTLRLAVLRKASDSSMPSRTIVADIMRDVPLVTDVEVPSTASVSSVHVDQRARPAPAPRDERPASLAKPPVEQQQDAGKTELFQTVLRGHLQGKKHACGFGCGYASDTEEHVEVHEQECTLKDSTSNMPSTTRERIKAITPETMKAFQHALNSLRTDIKPTETLSSARSLDASGDDNVSNGWKFRCLASQRIAGKYRRGDEVVSTVERTLGLNGMIKVGDIGVVVGQGHDDQLVHVRFQVGEAQLHGQTELRQCLYQDIIHIERERRKAAETRQKMFEDVIDRRRREEAERRTKPAAVQRSTSTTASAQRNLPTVKRSVTMTADSAPKDSFVKRLARTLSGRN